MIIGDFFVCDITLEDNEITDILEQTTNNEVDMSNDDACLIDVDLIESFIKEIKNQENKEDIIEKTILFLKRNFCLDAIGVRLQEGNDYPYYTTLGFSDSFVKAENYLCKRDANGDIIRDDNGKPILECLCGDIINKGVNFNHPCYTKRGSFYSIGSLSEVYNAMKCSTRKKCSEEGFESIAVVPIAYEGSIIGLLQMNHRKPNSFSVGLIRTAEEITTMLGQVLGGIIKKEQERALKRTLLAKNIKNIISELQVLSKEMVQKYSC